MLQTYSKMGHFLLAVKEMGGRGEKLLHSFRVKTRIVCFWPGIKPNVANRFTGKKGGEIKEH